MTQKDFDSMLESTFDDLRSLLCSKSKEYSTQEDKLANFKSAAAYLGCEPETALMGMWVKHLVSVKDYVRRLEMGDGSMNNWQEKIYDTINYALLLKALLAERGFI
jgi:hypothetical protein